MKRVCWLLLACGVAGAVHAADRILYKWIDARGHVVYSDEPPPQARKAERIVVPLPAPAESLASELGPDAQRLLKDADDRERGLTAANLEIDAAYRDLAIARAAASAGRDPLDTEHLGTYARRARFSDAYWSRQRQLQEAIGSAQRRLSAAIDRRNALR